MRDIPQFFSVIKTKALHRNKLKIPKKIVWKCGESLSEQACFKLPCGLDWKIGLTKSSDGNVWIDKGWAEFSKYYSIAIGHFLVFGYQGNSQFQVAIFDDTTIEIDYKSFGTEVKEVPKDGENIDTCPSPYSSEAMERDKSLKRTKTSPLNGQPSSHQSHGTLSTKEKYEALKRIRDFKFNHPSFILHIQPSFVQAKFYVSVPKDFAKSYLGTGCKQMIFKVDGKKKYWPVKYSFNGTYKPVFGAGWKAFAQENGLKRGDLCVFTMSKTTKSIIFEVTICRENRNADSTLVLGAGSKKSKPVCSERIMRSRKAFLMKSTAVQEPREILVENDEVSWSSKASKAASKFCSKHPLFQIDFPSSSLEMSTLSVPIWFARSYFEAKEQGVTLQVGERSWDVRMEYHLSNGYLLPQLRRGWFVFVNDNSLGARDSCIFELIHQKDQAIFKVSIFRDEV